MSSIRDTLTSLSTLTPEQRCTAEVYLALLHLSPGEVELLAKAAVNLDENPSTQPPDLTTLAETLAGLLRVEPSGDHVEAMTRTTETIAGLLIRPDTVELKRRV